MTTPPLQFSRTHAGRYHTTGSTHTYLITRNPHGKSWILRIYRRGNLAGAIHADTHDLKRDAVAVARAYEALGDDYSPAEHGYRGRYTEAIRRAYGPPAERPQPAAPEETAVLPSGGERTRYKRYRSALAGLGLEQLRELNEEISSHPSDPRANDTMFVKALHVAIGNALPRRWRSR